MQRVRSFLKKIKNLKMWLVWEERPLNRLERHCQIEKISLFQQL